MQSRYIFDKVNQDITAAIAREVARNTPAHTHQPTSDDLVCALIFIALLTFLIFA